MRRYIVICFLMGSQCICSQKNAIGINFAPIYTLSIDPNSKSTSDINYAIGFNYSRMIGKKVAITFEPNYTSVTSQKLLNFHIIELPTLCRFFLLPKNPFFIDVGSSNALVSKRSYFEPYYTISVVFGVGYQYHLNEKMDLLLSLRTRSPYIVENSKYAIFNNSLHVSGYYKF